jgi:4,5-DOPA dioxygenase extradiol
MNRKVFIQSLSLIPLTAMAHKLNTLENIVSNFDITDTMPVLFVGHGNPMNAIEDNEFTRTMKAVAQKIQKPKAILMISAHWETKGTFVTAMEKPKTIHDFGGFPQALFDVQYPALGSKWLAEETQKTMASTHVEFNHDWGFDHGCWSVTKNLYPNADVPIIQLSLDYTKDAQYHYDLAKQLSALRKKGVLIIGSGNMVHNFNYANFNATKAEDWAIEANETFKKQIIENDFKSLINYKTVSKATALSAPTPEHYLPLLYSIALREKSEELSFFNDAIMGGSFSMTSVMIGK